MFELIVKQSNFNSSSCFVRGHISHSVSFGNPSFISCEMPLVDSSLSDLSLVGFNLPLVGLDRLDLNSDLPVIAEELIVFSISIKSFEPAKNILR